MFSHRRDMYINPPPCLLPQGSGIITEEQVGNLQEEENEGRPVKSCLQDRAGTAVVHGPQHFLLPAQDKPVTNSSLESGRNLLTPHHQLRSNWQLMAAGILEHISFLKLFKVHIFIFNAFINSLRISYNVFFVILISHSSKNSSLVYPHLTTHSQLCHLFFLREGS